MTFASTFRACPTTGPYAVAGLLGLAAGALVAQRSSVGTTAVAAAVGAILVVLFAATLPSRVLAVLVVVSTQLTRGRFPLGGFHLLPEHVLLVAFALGLVMRSAGALFRRPAVHETLLLAWIAWNLAVTLSYSPDRAKSLAIVAWMALAWAILWCVRGYFLCDPLGRRRVLQIGSQVAALAGAVSFGLWALALLGGTRFGVQPEFNTGTLAAKGLTLEANFLGSQELCWLFLLLRGRALNRTPASPWQAAGLVLGIVASMTRAVWIASIVVAIGAFAVARLTDDKARAQLGPTRTSLRHTLAAGLLMSVLLISLGGPAVQKFRSSLDFGSPTATGRVANWELARDDMGSSRAYLTGFGTNSYGQRHLSVTRRGQPDYLGNLPLTVLYDSGIIGVFLFGAAMTGIVLHGRNLAARCMNLLFVLALMIVGAATSPVWFGFLWVTVATFDTDSSVLAPPLGGPSKTSSVPRRRGRASSRGVLDTPAGGELVL